MKDHFGRTLRIAGLVVGSGLCLNSSVSVLQARQAGDGIAVVIADVASKPFGVTMTDWQSRARTVAWQPYRGGLGAKDTSDLWATATNWCALGRDVVQGVRRESFFYPIRPERPFACRLEQLRYSVPAGANAQATYMAVARRLEAAYGEPRIDGSAEAIKPGDKREPDRYPKLWVIDVPPPQYARQWTTMAATISLFVHKTEVQVVARSHILTGYGYGYGRVSGVRADLREEWEVANAVRSHSRDATEIILSSNHFEDRALVARTAIALLERAQTRTGDERSILRLGAAWVLDKLHPEEVTFGERGIAILPRSPDLARLTSLGVVFEYDGHEGVWQQDGGLWHEVIRSAPDSRWGQLAFVARLEQGWSRECGDDYKDVIREGEAWMLKHASSSLAVRVILALAEAYETWWSLGQAPKDEEEFVDPDEHREGSREARAPAIHWYERLLRDAPDTAEATEALGSYIRLLENIDTGQRRFFCRIP